MINALLKWVGGKRFLRKKIAALIPEKLETYIEPFGGAGWVFFARERYAKTEIFNDIDGRLINLFTIVKYHPNALIEELSFYLNSRENFKRFLQIEPVTDIQKAAKFYYLISKSFAGKGEHFACSKKRGQSSFFNTLERIKQISARLATATIENLDFAELIKGYDFDGAFFYCDPPYFCQLGYDKKICGVMEHLKLCEALRNVKGRFLLSYNDCEEVRDFYKGFEMLEIERPNNISNTQAEKQKNKTYKELLIANYPIKGV